MKNFVVLFCFICIFSVLKTNGQDYLVTFAGTGASTNVSTVKVENLTEGTTLTVNGNDVLHLTSIITGVNSIEDNLASKLKIYPNPMIDNSTLEIYAPVAGNANISVYDMTGKLVAQTQSYLENSLQLYHLSGIKNGFYFINVTGNNYHFSGKIISNRKSNGRVSIEKINNIVQTNKYKPEKTDTKGIQATIEMDYKIGDRLKFTGISGNFSTVRIDIPTSSKTITFNFISCTDGSSINYPVVEIGTQIWMDENLKTTKYQNGDLIGTTTPATLDISYESLPEYQWAYGGNENNVSTYGRLYTWYAATDSRILCPSGWHIATDFEWTTLTNYLRDNGYGYEGSGSDIAKSIASTIGWNSSTEAGSIGSDLTSNNSSGFTSLPGGDRINDGTFLSLGNTSDWWAGTEFDASYGYFRNLYFDNNNMTQGYSYKNYGYAVRCLLTKFGTVTDYEGNAYKTVQLGPQEWMTENLKSTKYRDGTSIPYVIDDLGWDALTTPAYCWYLNDPTSYKNIYGALYNWYTVNTGKLCPTGWHVPIRADWLTLIDYLGGLDLAYEKLKSTTGWIGYGANNGTNESGFAAVPGGDRTYGTYGFMGDWGNWWSSTSYDPNTVWYLFIQSGSTNFVDLFTTNYKNSGYSVRCLKD